ncbi:MAG: hypothetical protein KatS3mg010_1455 [Acidimicrobiia bacterium]|nr:MAG: hypothetical protein KatS3mg010_1455 [Acidimicrobiia bacterium]
MNDTASSPLDGTSWVLAAADAFDLPPGVAITARFAEGRVAGSAGCNRYTAAVRVDAGTLVVAEAVTTCMACAPHVMQVERAYLRALAAARTWSVDGGVLVLTGADGTRLELAPEIATPVGGFEVTGYLDPTRDAFVSVLAGTRCSIELDAQGDVRGSAGCNRFAGRYTSDGSTIAFAAIAATREHCAEPEGVMAQERAFLAALASATRFEREAATFTLIDGEGRACVRARAV